MVPKKNLRIIQKFIDEGNKVILVSGRNIGSGRKVIKKIGRPVTLLGCNSAFVFENNKRVSETVFDNEKLKEVLEYIDAKFKPTTYLIMAEKSNCLMYCKRIKLFTLLFYPFWDLAQGSYHEPYKYISKKEFEKQLGTAKIYKVMIFLGIGNRAKAFASIANKYLNKNKPFCEYSWTSSSLELTPYGVNKASGIIKYCEEHNIDKNDVFVVGDSGNDIAMFKEFHEHSFCMDHGPTAVKKYAKYNISNFSELENYLFDGKE